MNFRFGIITDTHIRPKKGDQSSPYKVNDFANKRAEYAVNLLSSFKQKFTIHLGDVVHPLPSLPTYSVACLEAKKILKPLLSKMYFVPGNHDIGDKSHDASPAGPLNKKTISIYNQNFGPSWHSFVYKQIVLISINSSLVNSGLEEEKIQKVWLEKQLFKFKSKRIFLFSHYPPFIDNPNEPEHYDNYAKPGRKWLLNICEKANVEAIFSGHVHHFFYNRYKGIKMYVLPATSFVRQDYAEIFPIEPAPEFGRNDIGKFSVSLVEITKKNHRLIFLPTEGKITKFKKNQNFSNLKNNKCRLTPHMRHNWAGSVDLPYNGPMEEFSRKRARNDYPLMRLWQMGIQTVRTPISDLSNKNFLKRMHDWNAVGIKFSLFKQGALNKKDLFILNKNKSLISSFDIALKNPEKFVDKFKLKFSFPVSIGKIVSSSSSKTNSSKFAHSVSYGFELNDINKVNFYWKNSPKLGYVFQTNDKDNLDIFFKKLSILKKLTHRPITLVIRFAGINPAIPSFDNNKLIKRLSKAIKLQKKYPFIDLQVDTFMTIDRGYHPRAGLIDRLSNLTSIGKSLIL